MEAVLGRTPVLASQKTSKGLSTVTGVACQALARAVSAIEGMTVGGTIPSLTVAVVELADLVFPRQILDVLVVVVVLTRVGLSCLFHQIYVNWVTAAGVTAGVKGKVCDDKMGL